MQILIKRPELFQNRLHTWIPLKPFFKTLFIVQKLCVPLCRKAQMGGGGKKREHISNAHVQNTNRNVFMNRKAHTSLISNLSRRLTSSSFGTSEAFFSSEAFTVLAVCKSPSSASKYSSSDSKAKRHTSAQTTSTENPYRH